MSFLKSFRVLEPGTEPVCKHPYNLGPKELKELKKPHHKFHHAWESKTLDEDHILYAAMDAYLCLNIYKGWMKKQSPVSGSSKEASAKRKRDEDEVEDVDSDSE